MYELERVTLIPASREETFRFFSDVSKLGKITPRYVGLTDLTTDEGPVHAGMHVVHRIRWFGIPVRWTTVIESFDPPNGFVDVQEKGPYKSWRHEHTFEDVGGKTLMRDRVQYELPFGILGAVTHRLIVARQLKRIVDSRGHKIRKLFSQAATAA